MLAPSRLIILVALPMEARAVSSALRKGGVPAPPVQTIGLRGTRLPQAELTDAAIVIVAGMGGALDPRLRVGDLVLDTALENLPAHLPWHVGPIHTADRAVTTPADKARLFGETGASAVDMEQAAVRRAVPPGTRVIGLRAISDPADMALDPAVLRFLDPWGRFRPAAFTAAVVRRPALLLHLRDLHRNSRRALRNLGLAAAALVGRLAIDERPRQ